MPGVPLTLNVSDAAKDKSIFPVVAPPSVRVRASKLWSELVELSSTKPVPDPPLAVVAEREAIGEVAPFTFRTANLADVVALPPMSKSRTDASFGLIAPLATFQLLPPLPQLAIVNKQNVSAAPAVLGIVIVAAVELLDARVVKAEVCPPANTRLPLFVSLNLVVPEAEAVKIS